MGELIFCSVTKYDFSTYVRLYVCNDIYVYVTIFCYTSTILLISLKSYGI